MNELNSMYGNSTIDGVLAELIQSIPVQRLKGIHQGGASYLVNPKWNVTRYEHSVGVMLLIRKLSGSVEEQIAGLLHDISHTAFSHVIDFTLENQAEDYHEKVFHEVLVNSEIPSILEKHGFDYREIVLDDSQWAILEQPAPDLCADRVDYTLRDMYHYGKISAAEVKDFLNALGIVERKMCLNSIEAAEWFVETYYKEVIDFFMDPLNLYGYDRLAKAIKLALEKGVLSRRDLLLEDDEVFRILKTCDDREILMYVHELHPRIKVEENNDDYDFHRNNKLRMIDPLVMTDGQLHRASEISSSVRQMNDKAYQKSIRGTFVKILN